ncbi:cupin domain-containing protein [Desulforhopalus sp. IMCC35007]|uniref:cupin domain-containing protein n=1 Tax=Desulforhopalus sp. IMCC35007 TaxID=2569543 RepID=UPI0010AE6CD2|nr:cupin domain-containing protein [Desulforhopalus sp. IMCC35007]TKB06601.1 cupin domain-containing protein [Desulforhopalus sp. IMCC35007]
MSVSSTKKKRVSSGIPELDRLLGDLYIGDNVLWYEDVNNFSSAFCLNFIKETLTQKRPLIYVTFDRSPKNVVSFLGSQAQSQNLTILDCFTNGKGYRSEVFDKFYEKNGALWPYKVIKVNDPTNPDHVGEAMYGLHSNLSGDVHFILDSLTGMQSLWGGEDQVIDFYGKTCPRLYELDTIAYWLIEKGAHSKKLKANINKIAQVAIDLSVRRGKPTIKILKAEKRSSKFLNEHHEYLCEGSNIIFESQLQLKPKFDLGAKIKSTRLMRGISQKDLAGLTGVTPSTISQVEKNLIYPSLPALFRIAESLSVEVATLFKEHGVQPNVFVYPANSRSATSMAKVVKDNAQAELLLPPDIDPPVDATIIRIRPGKKLAGHFFAHKGSELGYLISGKLTMTVDNQTYTVNPGDTIYLQKDIPGSWSNISEQNAELLWLKLTK